MSHIRSIVPGAIRYTCGRYSREDIINCQTILAQDLADSGISLDQLYNHRLILDFLSEGHDPTIIAPLVNYLGGLVGIDNIRVLFNAVVDVTELPYRARSFVFHFATWDGRFGNQGDQSQVLIEQKFLCLARRPTPGRAQFVSQLLSVVPEVRASFGSGFAEMSQSFQSYFSQHALPIMIDGDARQYVHNLATDIFRTCLFNIIIETSSQTDPNSWSSIFLTEKTFKCFDLYQIPIWFAVPGTVGQLRKLGFDLFDDVVDHSYDTIPDPVLRMNFVVDQVKQLDSRYSLPDCQSLRIKMWNRLQENYNKLDQLTNSYTQTHDRLINELIA